MLESITPELRTNIRERGKEFVSKLNSLMSEFPEEVLKVQGTGLLCSAELRPEIPVVGFDGIEPWCRKGAWRYSRGTNALRLHLTLPLLQKRLI